MSVPMINFYVGDPMRFAALGTYDRETAKQLDRLLQLDWKSSTMAP